MTRFFSHHIFPTDEESSATHGAIFNGVFRGTIYDRGETYYVEPASFHFEQPQDFHSVIYKASDVDDPHDSGEIGSCGAKKQILERMHDHAETGDKKSKVGVGARFCVALLSKTLILKFGSFE